METGNGTTLVDIVSNPAEHAFVDPVIRKFVIGLEHDADTFCKTFEQQRWQENYAALLEVCRAIQRIRLEIGSLALLDPVHRPRTADALQQVVERIVGFGEKVAPRKKNSGQQHGIDQYVALFSSKEKKWAKHAVENIASRYEEIEG